MGRISGFGWDSLGPIWLPMMAPPSSGAKTSSGPSWSETAVRNYLDILTDGSVVRQLQPWFQNVSKRQVKSPKVVRPFRTSKRRLRYEFPAGKKVSKEVVNG